MCTGKILNFTQDSLVLIPYLLTCSQQCFLSTMDENLTQGITEITEDSDNHRMAKTIKTFY